MIQSEPVTLNPTESQQSKAEKLHMAVNVPKQSKRMLLSWIDLSTRSLIDRVLCPSEEISLPLHMRISTESSRIVGKEELLSCQPPRTCLSPWNVSPTSRPKPERRLSSPSLWRSTPLIERLSSADPLQVSLLDRVVGRHEKTLGESMNQEIRSYLPSKRKQSPTGLSVISPNDQSPRKMQRTGMPDLSDRDWGNQTCHGLVQQEEMDSPIMSSVAHAHVSSSNYMAKTSPGPNSLSAPPSILPKVFRPPNGSGYSGEKLSTSTISSLQSSALRSMKIGRHALEKHILHLT